MRAIFVKTPGGPEQLELRDTPDPTPSAHEVLIEVRATALNRADLLQRRGLYPPPPGDSEILGLECSGVVTLIGRDVSGVRVGDEVMALLGSGGYAERVCVHERLVLPIPECLSFETAAAVPEAFLTAHEALITAAELAPGERVLIHAAASGVGSAAVQIARELGAQVIATARGASKLAALARLGVHRAIDASSGSFAEDVKRVAPEGVDVVLDFVGAPYAEQNQAVLGVGGRWVVVGLLGGTRASVDLGTLLRKRQTLAGIVMRTRPLPEKAAIVRAFRRDLWPWVADGRIAPIVDTVFALAEAARAHERMETNANIGKIVLRVGDPVIRPGRRGGESGQFRL